MSGSYNLENDTTHGQTGSTKRRPITEARGKLNARVASSRGCRACRACRRGCREDATRKLRPGNFSLTSHAASRGGSVCHVSRDQTPPRIFHWSESWTKRAPSHSFVRKHARSHFVSHVFRHSHRVGDNGVASNSRQEGLAVAGIARDVVV